MGQINSTRNVANVQTNPEPVAVQASTDIQPRNETSDRPEPRPQARRRDRRKSLRNSIVGLVNPRSFRILGNDTNRENIGRRKWWPCRRRRSVVQLTRQGASPGDPISSGITPQAHTAITCGQTVGSASIDGYRFPVQATRTDGTTDGPTSASAEERKGASGVSPKGKERCMEVSDDLQDNNANTALSSGVTNAFNDSVSAEASGSSSSEPNTLPHQALQSPIDDNTQTAISPSPPEESSPQPPRNNFLRHFPPTGTLVVVQGIVHADNIRRATQDSPPSFFNPGRNSSSSTPDSEREQLDAVLTQRNESNPSETPESRSSSSAAPESATSNSLGTLSESLSSSNASSDNDENSNSQDGSPGNSPSNVDVLGALLSIVSVATATTAASLLSNRNGMSMPLPLSDRSSAFTRPSVNGSNLPLIARALASANPAQQERNSEERERNRMRSIWEGLRDRVSSGRGNRSPPETGSDSLLNELTRAFNLGPTRNERPSDARNTPEIPEARPPDAEVADTNPTEQGPSGSFEQFLVDLQADLRVALTRPDSDQHAGSIARPSGDRNSHANGVDEDPREDSNATVQSNAGDAHPSAGDEPASPEQEPTRSATSSTLFDTPESIVENNADESSMHLLCSDNTDRIPSSGSVDVPDSTLEPPAVAGPGVTRNGINWWRIYRFPPMRPVQLRTSSSVQDVENPAPIATLSAESGTLSANSSSRREETANVVPVIIVGLQSMHGTRQRVPPGAMDPLAGTTDNSEEPGRQEHSEIGNPEALAVPHTGRDTWSSRAARAFGRLGRRVENMTGRGHEGPNSNEGSRSFLIYVFGGHYPPDHHLLSGTGEMDSFEALWELAEFLGQVKPPVVTEEEIERSGLELFKAASVKEYENNGRVASNCVDRCLVCLDDYNPDDDLRLMACKHTFHKACVDRWLKTGRNNCPACRSEGVKTGNNASRSSQ